MSTVAELFRQLSGDAWRVKNAFTIEMLQANALLHNTAATEDEMVECLNAWSLKHQSCQFGRAAASQGRLHFCILPEDAVSSWSDDEIQQKINEEKRLWKQRAACDAKRAAHSFVIVVASPRVALAAPDQHLRAFGDRLLALAGWESDRRGVRKHNTITSDYLYLRKPADQAFYGFLFNVDFFACAGDGRWWRDHRFPGGIAFTANSAGHMMRFREWYDGKIDSEEWALKQAMATIRNAEPTKPGTAGDAATEGRATWLLPLSAKGQPLVERLACPLSKVPAMLEGKDWTRYEGVLHTDHAVREEFFQDREAAPTASKPYLMDFTYLYDHNQSDFERFAIGKPFTDDQVYAEIGRPEDWTHRSTSTGRPRTQEQAAEVARQLQVCRSWAPRHAVLPDP
ncbi:MAG: hypothetical protein ACREJD_08310 [Phycisphaerales bacterium]